MSKRKTEDYVVEISGVFEYDIVKDDGLEVIDAEEIEDDE